MATGAAILLLLATTGMAAAGGAGACVNGSGTTFRNAPTGAYVGVNVGTKSKSGLFLDQREFETQCCAESGREPSCFRPLQ